MKTGIVNRLCASAYKRALMLDHTISASLNTGMGVSAYAHTPELIVSLTTIPERVCGIHVVIDSLLRQSLKPDRVILWLNEYDEPGRPILSRGTLPESLTRLERRGLTIEWCRNIGSYCKLIPALRMFPNALIATADDDVYYSRDWLRGLYETYIEDPRSIPCHRAHLMRRAPSGGFLPYREWEYYAPGVTGPEPLLFPTGVGGILYAPGHLHPDVTNESIFLKLCPKADDVWFKAMALANGTISRKVSALSPRLFSIRYRGDRRLMQDNVCGEGNDRQLRAVAQYCPALATLAGMPRQTLSWKSVMPEQAAIISA